MSKICHLKKQVYGYLFKAKCLRYVLLQRKPTEGVPCSKVELAVCGYVRGLELNNLKTKLNNRSS